MLFMTDNFIISALNLEDAVCYHICQDIKILYSACVMLDHIDCVKTGSATERRQFK